MILTMPLTHFMIAGQTVSTYPRNLSFPIRRALLVTSRGSWPKPRSKTNLGLMAPPKSRDFKAPAKTKPSQQSFPRLNSICVWLVSYGKPPGRSRLSVIPFPFIPRGSEPLGLKRKPSCRMDVACLPLRISQPPNEISSFLGSRSERVCGLHPLYRLTLRHNISAAQTDNG